MSLAFLLPGALAALAALALPILLHLARRDEHTRIDFAALRWLTPEARPRRRLRLEDLPLLAARLLLLALIALWLAQPALFGAGDRRPFVAVMPGAEPVLSSLPKDARLHWLAEDFPALEDGAPGAPQPVASLLRQLDAELDADAALIVLATARFDGADGELPQLSRAVDWRIVPGIAPDSPPASAAEYPILHLVADESHASGSCFLRAAALAWRENATPPVLHTPDDPLPANDHVVVWLVEGALPEMLRNWISAGGTAVLGVDAVAPEHQQLATLWQRGSGETLAEGGALGRGRLLRLTRELVPDALPELLDAGFPERLAELLDAPTPVPTRADAHRWKPRSGAAAWPEMPRSLQGWLALLIALAFALERWLAAARPHRDVR